MKKNIVLLSWAALLLAGCVREAPVPPLPEETPFVTVGLLLAADDAETGAGSSGVTRSQLSVSGAERFYKAALFAFDHATGAVILSGGQPCVKFSDETDFAWALPAGRSLDIYAAVNYGSLDLSSYASDPSLTREDLIGGLVFSCPSDMDFARLDESGYGIPMAGVLQGRVLSADDDVLTVPVRKLFARYEIYLDKDFFAGTGLSVTAAYLRSGRSNTEVPFFQEGFSQTDPAKLREMDFATESDLLRLAVGGPDNAVTIYLPENCQGDKTPAANWYSVESVPGNDLSLCSCLRIRVEAGDEFNNRRMMDYSVYPGTDLGGAQGNFDVPRNRKQTLGLRLGAGPAFVLDVEGAVYLPTTGTLTIPFAARGISSADEIADRSALAPPGFSLTGKTLTAGEYSIGGATYPQHGTLTLRTAGVPFGTAFIFCAGTPAVQDSKNAVILPSGIVFEGENRSYMPDHDPGGCIEILSAGSFALDPSLFSGLEVAFSRRGQYYSPNYGFKQYGGSASFVPSATEPGKYRIKVSIPYTGLISGSAYDLRGPGRILARARNSQNEYVYFTMGDATVHLCLAVCSYLAGPGGFSETTNMTTGGFRPYAVTRRFLCPGVYCPPAAAGHFSFIDYDDEDPDVNGHFHLPFRVSMDPNTIQLGNSYYTINERGTSSAIGLHVPAVGDGLKRGTSVSVYVYEEMDESLLETDWYDDDIEDWSAGSVWYEGEHPYPETLFPYRGMWSIYWSGPTATHSYTGSAGTAPDGRCYQDIDVINLIHPSGNLQDYYLRVYDWTEGQLEDVCDELMALYE
jgi:hypothetical protein